MAKKLKPFHLFAPISRVNDEERIVEGHAFVNEVVEGEGGIRLLRTTMEAATPDYMRWGAVREMHQPSAVGTALGVEWDATGAYFRAKVVDDAAWAKVKAGVYKGFSVGVLPRVMRGNQVTAACWAETSLVDRPKDPDAAFSVFRAEGVTAEETAPDAEVEVEELEPEQAEQTDPPAGDPEPTPSVLEAALQPLLTRMEAIQTQLSELVTRAETAEAAVVAAQARVAELERTPMPPRGGTPPVRYPQALERTFAANGGETPVETESLKTELQRLEVDLPKEPDEQKRLAGAARIGVLKRLLAGQV